jgi:hypothetical protein
MIAKDYQPWSVRQADRNARAKLAGILRSKARVAEDARSKYLQEIGGCGNINAHYEDGVREGFEQAARIVEMAR